MYTYIPFKHLSLVAVVLAALPGVAAAAFNSGSTGADGALNPSATVELQLPPSGIFHYTSVNIPAGVTVTFKKNALNTPVTILASGDVTIAGTINISGADAQNVGTSALADYTAPGVGGPGGFDGGRGGLAQVNSRASNGLGPGAGGGGSRNSFCNGWAQGGGGAGYKGGGNANGITNNCGTAALNTGFAGGAYGTDFIVPLLGGSGGGGGAGGTSFQGAGGGGGAGAILIAASGTVNVTGSILANGGRGGRGAQNSLTVAGSCGGAGSGGAIRIVASNITGNGALSVSGGGISCTDFSSQFGGGSGGSGRINTQVTTTGTLNVTGFPTLTISSVGGISAPAAPTGTGDVSLAADAPNPVTVVVNTTGVPLTNTVTVTVTPLRGDAFNVVSPPLSGTVASATTSVDVNFSAGETKLLATTSYTIVAALGDELSRYAKGERVEKIELAAASGGEPTATLITVSGKRHTVPSYLIPVGG